MGGGFVVAAIVRGAADLSPSAVGKDVDRYRRKKVKSAFILRGTRSVPRAAPAASSRGVLIVAEGKSPNRDASSNLAT
jgi:hypothetical protein